MFGENAPESKHLEALEGITWPAGNTTEELLTICAITDYLENHMPTIISDLTEKHLNDLITNIIAFKNQFKAVVNVISRLQNPSIPKQCHRNATTSNDFSKKETGLRIIHFSIKWVEHFTNTLCVGL